MELPKYPASALVVTLLMRWNGGKRNFHWCRNPIRNVTSDNQSEVSRSYSGVTAADGDQRLIVARRRVLAEPGQRGANSADALLRARCRAIDQQLIEAIGSKQVARRRAIPR